MLCVVETAASTFGLGGFQTPQMWAQSQVVQPFIDRISGTLSLHSMDVMLQKVIFRNGITFLVTRSRSIFFSTLRHLCSLIQASQW